MMSQPEKPDKKELRQFGLITGTIAVVLFGLLLPLLFGTVLPVWPWFLAGVLWIWALLLPASLLNVYLGWMRVGHALGWINTRIILGIMYYALFLPAGMIMKLLGKDPMARKIIKSQQSYRVIRPHREKDHVEKPY